MKKLKRTIQKKMNVDYSAMISEIQSHFGYYQSLLVDEKTYDELSLGLRFSLIIQLPESIDPEDLWGKELIIAPSYIKDIHGKPETRALGHGTIFHINDVVYNKPNQYEVEGLKYGYALIEVDEVHPVTESIIK
ncbi:hypothetical protein SAMN05421690_10404 [Nitrosomonas sp. Nm51]|uniref:hypothetical protein n=1 Tax=Nitrosomonas sp. Nm51 TaxID=133720 RepID=UPI0008C388CA|nr:hypothetical protein [Nitrosomonas sp. Nm51]SER57923.1 hypothetical protein SAMN05421690_10404 [Nitrosomonas sp. Nm51]